jgi:ABC-2 type transport system ATP-binding protein
VIAEGTSDELKDRVGGERLEVTLDDPSRKEAAISALAPMVEDRPKCDGALVELPISRRRGAIAEAVRRLDSAGVGIDDIAVHRPTLDDVFLVLTGHTAEEAAEEDGAPPERDREEEREAA